MGIFMDDQLLLVLPHLLSAFAEWCDRSRMIVVMGVARKTSPCKWEVSDMLTWCRGAELIFCFAEMSFKR